MELMFKIMALGRDYDFKFTAFSVRSFSSSFGNSVSKIRSKYCIWCFFFCFLFDVGFGLFMAVFNYSSMVM